MEKQGKQLYKDYNKVLSNLFMDNSIDQHALDCLEGFGLILLQYLESKQTSEEQKQITDEEEKLTVKQALRIGGVSTRLLTRIAIDLEKEMKRSDNDRVIADLEMQIDGLKALKKELDDFRTIKAILNGCYHLYKQQ